MKECSNFSYGIQFSSCEVTVFEEPSVYMSLGQIHKGTHFVGID